MNNLSEQSHIKFDHQNEYDEFIKKLTRQVKTYTEESCLCNGIRLGSSDAKVIEEVIFDVFLKHTIELMRPNLSISGLPIPAPPDFQSLSKPQPNPTKPTTTTTTSLSGQTKPIDASLTERVVRQQYAVNEAAVDNSRKRKGLPNHLISLVNSSVDQHRSQLDGQVRNGLESNDDWLKVSEEIDPRNRWKIINDEVTNIKQAQEDYTTTGLIISNLLTSLPSIVDKTERAIELEETYGESFNPAS
ncbi:uncharacterized protein MELLADRAFT_72297 [Melampsora larici-populina 98AG31]|uniref:Uncharacterized protein n=1 Tax=Melampsora larici-populina (strain 98AG31 / pathotype 3-4-7) TaxID=747676 RepID=F4RS41_MELLP|nr:uncharacterized protein MELLADRAFT_72297 [Melampsora larici-populina 98AG31]EGG04786.1 hypothetical protein MELLADRAFT_72297 [Melampsora larici-populina 98AG31]